MNRSEELSQKDIYKVLKPFTLKGNTLPYLIFAIDFLLFISLLYYGLMVESLIGKAILGSIQGLVIVFLFVVGHDCCHGSYTNNTKINGIFGRIAFLPSLHNFGLWELGHNKIHHGFTNLKQQDYTYTPLSPDEYLALNFINKIKYRIYRTAWGHGIYYGYEIWLKRMILPNSKNPNLESYNKGYLLDSILLILYSIVLLFVIQYFSVQYNQSFFINLLLVFVFPFSIWNWSMGFAIYQHHTNTDIKWFDNVEEWNYWESQIDHSAHIRFPKPINFVLHNIMEHTAHHGNMNIPLYKLAKAQLALENHFGDRIQVIDWTFSFYFNSINKCKLYDYKNHKWLTFRDLKNY